MWFYQQGKPIEKQQKQEMMVRLVDEAKRRFGSTIRKVLLLPPDITRYHSGAGQLTNMLYKLLPGCKIDLILTLGQHTPHTPQQNKWMFGDIPQKNFHNHDWITSCKVIGQISKDYVQYVSENRADWPIPVNINPMVVENNYDLVVNIGQIVPHEVLGFSNHNKNYFIGLGCKSMICASHMMAASCGIENNLGMIITPLRACFNKAERHHLSQIPDVYVLIVMSYDEQGKLITTGLYVGDDVKTYTTAARYAQQNTVKIFEKPVKKAVAVMDERGFKSTWVANKAIYRTRMAIADGGQLIIIAPGVERFGEQKAVDDIIRKYGYKGTPYILENYKNNKDLQDLAHGAAHLIHGSSEKRFTITYAPGKLSKQDIENVGYDYLDIKEALRKYNPDKLKEGYNTVDGEEIYFISSPSAGLWTSKEKFLLSLKNNHRFIERMLQKEPDEQTWPKLKKWISEDIKNLH
jgi:nickel-dependent lactate racemase